MIIMLTKILQFKIEKTIFNASHQQFVNEVYPTVPQSMKQVVPVLLFDYCTLHPSKQHKSNVAGVHNHGEQLGECYT